MPELTYQLISMALEVRVNIQYFRPQHKEWNVPNALSTDLVALAARVPTSGL